MSQFAQAVPLVRPDGEITKLSSNLAKNHVTMATLIPEIGSAIPRQ